MHKKHLSLIIGLLFIVTAFHLMTPQRYLYVHILLRVLYLIPIGYAGLVKGKKGGLITAVIASLLFSPHFFFRQAPSEFHIENLVALVIFLAIGLFTGMYRDLLKKRYISTTSKPYNQTEFGKNFLVYLDNTSLSFRAIDWIVEFLGVHEDVLITLLWVVDQKALGYRKSGDAEGELEELTGQAETQLSQSIEKLKEGGISEYRIRSKIVPAAALPGRPITDKILEELSSCKYDTILVPRHNMNKTQEFLLGDVAVNLLRKSSVPIIAVKEATDNGEHSIQE